MEDDKDLEKEKKEEKPDLTTLMLEILKQETSKEMQEVKMQILKRIATEADIKPARIPAPINITQIGGYYNLLKGNKELQLLLLASVLGLPYSPNKLP